MKKVNRHLYKYVFFRKLIAFLKNIPLARCVFVYTLLLLFCYILFFKYFTLHTLLFWSLTAFVIALLPIILVFIMIKNPSQKNAASIEINTSLLEKYTQLLEIREKERNNITKIIHDDLGQYLTMLKLNASWLKDHLVVDQKEEQQKIDSLLIYAQNAIDASRKLITSIQPNMLDSIGLISTLNWYITTFSQSTGVAVNLQVEPNHINFFEKVNLCIYRILQESLTNILRHANATKVDITLIHKNGQLNLTIKDDGVGFDMNTIDSSKHHGLKDMQERVYALGGNITILSQLNEGTVIKVELPDVLLNTTHIPL